MTEKHYLLTDQQFEEKFKNGSLAPKLFTHEAHLRLAYIHLKKYKLNNAIKNLCEQISVFDQKCGDGKKFDKTVTIAATHVINGFIHKSKSTDFRGLLKEFPRLKNNFSALLRTHYALNSINHKEVKPKYVKRDLLPLN